MLRLSNTKASLIQGLIALKGLKTTLKAWQGFNSLGEANGETTTKTKKTLFLRAPLVAIGAQKSCILKLQIQNYHSERTTLTTQQCLATTNWREEWSLGGKESTLLQQRQSPSCFAPWGSILVPSSWRQASQQWVAAIQEFWHSVMIWWPVKWFWIVPHWKALILTLFWSFCRDDKLHSSGWLLFKNFDIQWWYDH